MLHERELTQFLTTDVSYFEHSTFGPQIELIISRAYGSRQCPKCGGLGILDEPWVRDKDYNGHTIDPIELPTGKECGKCKGVGYLPVRINPGGDTVTARPTKDNSHRIKEAPPTNILVNYARVSRRLRELGKRRASVLLAAYGDEGQAYSMTPGKGRSWAVIPLTPQGRKLIESVRSKNPESIDCWRGVEAINTIERQNISKPRKERKELLKQAIACAQQWLTEAEKAWEGSYGSN